MAPNRPNPRSSSRGVMSWNRGVVSEGDCDLLDRPASVHISFARGVEARAGLSRSCCITGGEDEQLRGDARRPESPGGRAFARRPAHARGYAAAMSTGEMTFLIRPVRPEEYKALGELTVAAYHALPGEMNHQDSYDRRLRDVATRARVSCVLVAVGPADEVLGGVTYVRGPDDPYSEELREGEAGMRMLAVDPARQRHGLGRALTQACLDRARAAGRQRLVLHTGSWMPDAVRLYERMGFVRRLDLDFTPVPGIDLIAYSFELGSAVE
jgi:GNAT superfamily N-acetyltransferase